MAQNRVLEVDMNITKLKEKDINGISCRLTLTRDLKVIPWYCIAHPYCARF